ncbi:MAG TPA: TIGR00730 family Rossman fold protein [Candidatus Saccharimonadia bacterium]|nr:TIGR00730 family Rossman fold protein [Candidatus Saccharimonadia bacterium]
MPGWRKASRLGVPLAVPGARVRVCVYCASSDSSDPEYRRQAYQLGVLLAQAGCTVVYGGGGVGSMGALADGALSQGGRVIGVIPKFMTEVEWQHPGLATLEVVEDMRERKHRLLAGSDAVIALPGGCGTLEELFEAITLKRLGLYFNPIVLVNTRGYYTPLAQFLDLTIAERFMNPEHAAMWSVVERVEDVLQAIRSTPAWHENARDFAVVRP